MKSSNIAYNPRLDHIRFFAAGLVFVFHSIHYFYLGFQPNQVSHFLGLFTEGHTGIGLFFTLSGFLFMQIALKNPDIDYAGFIKNRFLRIFPLFIVVFLVAVSINRDNFSGADWSYLLFSNIGDAPTSMTFLTGAAWTIGVEFLFYLVFPFIARITLQQGIGYLLRWVLLFLIFKLAAFDFLTDPIHVYYSTILGRFDQFLLGMVFGLLYYQYHAKLQKTGWLAIIGISLVVVLNGYLQSSYGSFFSVERQSYFWITWSIQEAVVWGLFIMIWASASIKLPRWIDTLMQRGGEISFSFYLLHAFVIHLGFSLIGPITPTPWLLVNAFMVTMLLYMLTWPLAVLSYETIEKPFLAWRVRYGVTSSSKRGSDQRLN